MMGFVHSPSDPTLLAEVSALEKSLGTDQPLRLFRTERRACGCYAPAAAAAAALVGAHSGHVLGWPWRGLPGGESAATRLITRLVCLPLLVVCFEIELVFSGLYFLSAELGAEYVVCFKEYIWAMLPLPCLSSWRPADTEPPATGCTGKFVRWVLERIITMVLSWAFAPILLF